VTVASVLPAGDGFEATGFVTVSPATNEFASSVTIDYRGQTGQAVVDAGNGTWTFHGSGVPPAILTATSSNQGVAVYGLAIGQKELAVPQSQLKSAPGKARKKRRDNR
jgi:hypothetical protein